MVRLHHTAVSTLRFRSKWIWYHGRHVLCPNRRWLFGEDWLDCYAKEILDAQYEWTDVTDVVNKLTNLNTQQKADLIWELHENNMMFDGTLGTYPYWKAHIELLPSSKPMHLWPYPGPCMHLATFKCELDHLVNSRVLIQTQEGERASPSFIISKKDGCMHWIIDLRHLNKVIKRRQFLLPIILDILRKCSGYKFFTKLDISMQNYTFELDEESQDLCTINTSFSKYKYAKLPWWD